MKIKSIEGMIFHSQPQPTCYAISNELFALTGEHEYKGSFKYKGCYYYFNIFFPDGYIWDKRTIPKAFRWIRERDGLVELAALIHDKLYKTKGIDITIYDSTFSSTSITLSRKVCDQFYREIYKVMDKKNNTADRDYLWLRMFGWIYWGEELP